MEYRPSCVVLNKKLLASSDDDDEDDSNASQASAAPSPQESKHKSRDTKGGSEEPEVNVAGDEEPRAESPPASEDATVDAPKQESPAEEEHFVNPIEVAKERLLGLEAAIERRYVRPPLGTRYGRT